MKRKMFSLVFSLIFICSCFLLGNIKVNAEEPVKLYYECGYDFSTAGGFGKEYLETYIRGYYQIANPTKITIGYTEVVDDTGYVYPLYADPTGTGSMDPALPFYVDGKYIDWFKADIRFIENNPLDSFVRSVSASDCPNYMHVQFVKTEKKKQYYKLEFSNEKPSNCTGNDSTCIALGVNQAKLNNYYNIYPSEDIWERTTVGEKGSTCDNLNVKLYVHPSSKKFLADFGYVQPSSYQAQSVVGSPVKYYDFFPTIRKIALGQIGDIRMFVNPREGGENQKEGVSFEYSIGSTYCEVTTSLITKGKSCATVDDFSQVWKDIANKIDGFFPDINSIYSNLTIPVVAEDYNPNEYQEESRAPKTFTSETDINKLLGYISEYDSKLLQEKSKDEEYKLQDEINSISNGTHPSLNGKKPCQETIKKAETFKGILVSYTATYNSKMTLIKDGAINARNRAEELGANQEQLQQADKTIYEMENTIERTETFIRRVRSSMLDDFDFKLSNDKLKATGCGIISDDLKEFLNLVLWYIRIGGVVLAIILSLLDYVKAATGSDDKSMAAANKKFITRVMLVAVLFLVPVLLEFILEAFNISTTAGSLECLK